MCTFALFMSLLPIKFNHLYLKFLVSIILPFICLPAMAQKEQKVNPEDRKVDMTVTFVPMVRVEVLEPATASNT